MRCPSQGFMRKVCSHAVNFEDNAAGTDNSNKMVHRTLSSSNRHFCTLMSNRFVRKYSNPDFSAPLHVARHSTARRLDLAGRETPLFEGLQAPLPKGKLRPPG